MELIAEKESNHNNNENNNNNNNVTSYAQALVVDSHDNHPKESDEVRERHARDLKAGLHPLKVPSLSLSSSLPLSLYMYRV